MKMKENKLRLWEVVLMTAFAVVLLSGAVSLKTQDFLAEKVVRLHVLANSNSPEDQALKLTVRDAVIVRTEELLRASSSREEAQRKLQSALPELEALAEETLRKNGCANSVTAELRNVEFPTKEYDGFTLPAGEYLALRLLIGEARGQNWWCVVFPPLCTAAETDLAVSALSAGFSEEELSLITEENAGYVLKFKSVELWETIRQKLWERPMSDKTTD